MFVVYGNVRGGFCYEFIEKDVHTPRGMSHVVVVKRVDREATKIIGSVDPT